MPDCYTTADIAEAAGVGVRMVRRYLADHYEGRHFYREWWKLSLAEFESAVNALKCAKITCPAQPLHAFKKGQSFLELF